MNPTGARYVGRGEWGAVRRCVHEGEVDLNRKRTRNGRSSRASRKSQVAPADAFGLNVGSRTVHTTELARGVREAHFSGRNEGQPRNAGAGAVASIVATVENQNECACSESPSAPRSLLNSTEKVEQAGGAVPDHHPSRL